MENLSDLLAKKITEKYGTVTNLAKKINKKPNNIYNILNRTPNKATADTIKIICEALEIDMYSLLEGKIEDYIKDPFKLTLKEKHLIEDYRKLDQYGIDVIDTVLSLELDRNIYYDNKIKFMWLPFPDTRASAGTGQEMLDYSEFVKIPRTDEAETCDFVVKISGDSMIPMFEDGDCVLVKSTKELNIGDIGLFILNNEAYIKEMGDGQLISKNPSYEPILLNDSDVCLVVGKIVSKTEIIE